GTGTGSGSSTGGGGGTGSTGTGTTGSTGTAGSGASGTGGTGATGTGSSGAGGSGTTASDAGINTTSWDWNGVVGSGQSLSVGTPPQSNEFASTTQPFNNLMLQLGDLVTANEEEDASIPPPWDASIPGIKMVPLVEPVRPIGSGFPRPYPVNIWGETNHAAMANEITTLVKAGGAADYVSVHTVVGESGQGIVALVKDQPAGTLGATGRAYAATLFEATNITALAKAAGKTYGVSVIVMTHGETDATNPTYGDSLVQLLKDYNADIPPITGQTKPIPMYLSQQHAYPCYKGPPLGCSDTAAGGRPLANQIEWQLGVMYPGQFVCTGPKYQYPANPDNDGIHLSATGYQLLGEKSAEVYYQREVLGHNWQPLYPTGATRSGNVVTVTFNVPVPPLSWDMTLDAPLIKEWTMGNGFELWEPSADASTTSNGTNVTISSVAIVNNTVQITASGTLPTNLMVGYAMADQGAQMKVASKAVRWGRLMDSDSFAGSTTKKANPNYAVSFQMQVP
ncbi:MAG TPA: dockerin, partial [Polyangiaceae bacterium]|nr:dockerin [Polyangiaceae bacterium]